MEEGLDDGSNIEYLNSDLSTTEVTLCHASIGDFFCDTSKGQVSAGEGCLSIGVDFNKAKVSICRACLSLLCDKEMQDKNGEGSSMIPYAQSNWYSHLRSIDRSKCTAKSYKTIRTYFLRIFRDDEFVGYMGSSCDLAIFQN